MNTRTFIVRHAAAVLGLGAMLAASAAPVATCVIVPADQEWVATGIHVNPTEFVCVKGDGL